MRFWAEGIQEVVDTDDFTPWTTITMPCPEHSHYITVSPQVVEVRADGQVYIAGHIVEIEEFPFMN